jgi:hypothetical protein
MAIHMNSYVYPSSGLFCYYFCLDYLYVISCEVSLIYLYLQSNLQLAIGSKSHSSECCEATSTL